MLEPLQTPSFLSTQAEITRIEDALLRFCPFRQWQIKAVTFPATANTDLDIAHTLQPTNDEIVDYLVIQNTQPVIIYHDATSTRTAWSDGVIRLRATAPSAQVVLLIVVRPDVAAGETLNITRTTVPAFTVPKMTSGAATFNEGLNLSGEDNVTIGIGTGDLGSYNTATASPVVLRLTTVAGNLAGIPAAGASFHGGLTGRFHLLLNDTTSSFTIAHNDAGAAATGNRFFTPDNLPVTVRPDEIIAIWRDETDSRWRVIGGASHGRWQAYTPAWTAVTTNPTIGNGTLSGRYSRNGNTIHFEITIQAGSTTTFGTGDYRYSLPVAASASSNSAFTGYARDDSTGTRYLLSTGSVTSTTVAAFADVSTANVSPTVPFTWASPDSLRIVGTYEV